MKRKYVALFFIILIAVFLRFFNLANIPPSLTWDEVAWGYNAYSLGIDGKDEYGRFLPLDYLESFGDFKPPVYAYLTVLPVKIFGLNEFAVRFPSALFGVLTVIVTYFLVREIFFYQSKTSFWQSRLVGSVQNLSKRWRFWSPQRFALSPQNDEGIALLSALFLAISPWHINLSRAAFEANVATFFIVLGVLFFLKTVSASAGVATNPPQGWTRGWTRTRGVYLTVSVISFALSIYTFNTARVFSPVMLTLLSLIFLKSLWKIKYRALVAIVIGIILILPVTRFLFSPQASLRFKEVNIFSDIGVIERTNQEIGNDKNVFWSRILHNRRIAFSVEYIRHYLDHFNPDFLFIRGDGNPKFSTQDVGQMYLWELPFFVAGFLFLFRQRLGHWWIAPLWMAIGIIPAATARETPHALRIEAALPTFQIFTAYGVFVFISKISNLKSQISNLQAKYLIFSLTFLFLIFNFSYYLQGYYAHYPREYSGEWQYAYRESTEYVRKVQKEYEEIHVTTKLGRPYIYYAFYMRVDPQVFRNTVRARREPLGFVTVEKFSKYRFSDTLGNIKTKAKRILYIDAPDRVPAKAQVLETFYLLNGGAELVAYIR